MPAKTLSYERISVKNIEQDFAAAYQPGLDRITGMITRAGNSSGEINLRAEQRQDLIDRVGAETMALFVGPDKKNAYARDGVTALAPFPNTLNRWYVRIVAEAVKSHHDYMKQKLPDDVYRWLRGARAPQAREMVGMKAIIEQVRVLRPGFAADALNDYERMHTWKDKNGYVLNQRVWRNGFETSDRMERLLGDLLANGTSSLEISRLMEQFLLPGKAALRTQKPYGSDASYYGMRLARSEIAFAANRSSYISALLNPFVDTIDIARSSNGDPFCKICPQYATIDIAQMRVKPAYPLNGAPVPIYHSHCMCRVQSNVGKKPQDVIDQLRQWMDERGEPPITPADENLLLLLLLGPILLELLKRMIGGL